MTITRSAQTPSSTRTWRDAYPLFKLAHTLFQVVAIAMAGAPGAHANDGIPAGASSTRFPAILAQAVNPPAVSILPAERPARLPATHGRKLPATPWEASTLNALARPDTLIMIRHANAPGVGDPEGFALNRCATQRNLDNTGRAQAEALGNRWKQAGIFPSRIFTSAWCRCVDTAIRLQMGPVAIMSELNASWEAIDPRTRQTARLKDFIYRLDPRGGPYVMVTHQINITELTGAVVNSANGVVLQLGSQTPWNFQELPEK